MESMSVEHADVGTSPVTVTVVVERPPVEAFHVFTAGMARWWPLRSHSVSRAHAVSCVIEPRAGGAVYEVQDDGQRHPWGRVLEWTPPWRVVLSWHPGRPEAVAQEVEIRFAVEGAGTRVDLEHRGWARLGSDAVEARKSYEGGWRIVLGTSFVQACRRDGRPA
jgi:uncharacterized protein YndB with AHSA1/START domain